LNKALDGLQGLRERRRFGEPKTCLASVARYQAENDELAAWLDDHTTARAEAAIPQSELHEPYIRHCRKA
jgi:phage/plasmid-associated DNA primase